MKYIDFYNKSIRTGIMVSNYEEVSVSTSGLCDAFRHRDDFELMRPTDDDRQELIDEGKSTFCWASDDSSEKFYEFTPLRQNIVLLLAAMNNEL